MTDQGPYLYEVGKLYNPNKRVWPEGYQYSYRGGPHELLLLLRTPHPLEVAAVRDGDARFSFNTFGPDVLIFSYGFRAPDGQEINGDCPYSIWLTEERRPPTLDFPEGIGAILSIFLIDAESGILKAIRVCGLGRRFSIALHKVILAQLARPGLPPDYDDQLARIWTRFTTQQLLNRGTRYRAGTREPPMV